LELDDVRASCACGAVYKVIDGIPELVDDLSPLAQEQARWFDEEADEEWEIERPQGAPRLHRWLLEQKFHQAVDSVPLQSLTAVVACGGSGMDAEFLARRGAQVIGVDVSPRAARRARERADRHGFRLLSVVADVQRLPLADQSVDVAYVHDGLHHLDEPLRGVAELGRVARRAVCISEPAQAAVTALAVRFGIAEEREDSGNRVTRLELDAIGDALRRQGFEVTKSARYAMFYRHYPGNVTRLLSQPGLFDVARLSYLVGNAVGGRFGNKLAVVAVRR
jgi:ubiquinone/menaquinone biosynthesis C-methylase UbiE